VNFKVLKQIYCALVGVIKDWISKYALYDCKNNFSIFVLGEELPQCGKWSQVTIVCQLHESLEWSALFLLPGGEKCFFPLPNPDPLWRSHAPPPHLMCIGCPFNEVKMDVP
jgi:hypothetical protein